MMRGILLALLLFCSPALAATPNPLKICHIGDIQYATACTNATTAWDHIESAVQWIVDNPSYCDVVLFPGDVVLFQQDEDCWCATQEVDNETCITLENPDFGTACPNNSCNIAVAIACDGGTAGSFCEWTRAQALFNMLKASNIPVIVSFGNHDPNSKGMETDCTHEATIFNSYFGADHLSTDFDSSGSFSYELDCAGAADGKSTQADSSWHLLTAAGTQWLFINASWPTVNYEVTGMHGLTEELLGFIQDTIDDHLGVPTFLISHFGVGDICNGLDMPASYVTHYENAWCGDSLAWWKYSTASGVYDYVLMDAARSKQLIAYIGGHIRDNAYTISQNTPYHVAGITFDYGDLVTIPQLAADCPWQTKVNGGGGIVQRILVDPQANTISTTAYSPEEDAWCDVRGDEPATHYELSLPMCADQSRFNFPATVCPEREPSPECCRK